MKYLIALFGFIISFVSSAQQLDTLYTLDKKIIASVKEVSPEQVSYVLPNDQVIHKVSKHGVVKIVYSSGSTEQNKLSKQPIITGPEEWEKVIVVDQSDATQGLYKICDISVSASRVDWFRSNKSKLHENAKRELKMIAAMQGGNVVYLTSQSSGVLGSSTYLYPNNYRGRNYGYYGHTTSYGSVENLNGSVFSSKLLDTLAFQNLANTEPSCRLFSKLKMRYYNGKIIDQEFRTQEFTLKKYTIENGNIIIHQELKGIPVNQFRVTYFDEKKLILSYQHISSYYTLAFFIE
jgi:hypothetical protein